MLANCLGQFCDENALKINVKKTKAMFINCSDRLKIGNVYVKSVKDFKYLGLILANNSKKPDALLLARIHKSASVFYAIRSNCKLLGISNVRVKL